MVDLIHELILTRADQFTMLLGHHVRTALQWSMVSFLQKLSSSILVQKPSTAFHPDHETLSVSLLMVDLSLLQDLEIWLVKWIFLIWRKIMRRSAQLTPAIQASVNGHLMENIS